MTQRERLESIGQKSEAGCQKSEAESRLLRDLFNPASFELFVALEMGAEKLHHFLVRIGIDNSISVPGIRFDGGGQGTGVRVRAHPVPIINILRFSGRTGVQQRSKCFAVAIRYDVFQTAFHNFNISAAISTVKGHVGGLIGGKSQVQRPESPPSSSRWAAGGAAGGVGV
jgi:hypothetical protein